MGGRLYQGKCGDTARQWLVGLGVRPRGYPCRSQRLAVRALVVIAGTCLVSQQLAGPAASGPGAAVEWWLGIRSVAAAGYFLRISSGGRSVRCALRGLALCPAAATAGRLNRAMLHRALGFVAGLPLR